MKLFFHYKRDRNVSRIHDLLIILYKYTCLIIDNI